MAAHKLVLKVIVITGASSGIGQALAEHYADAGIVLGLTGRNQARLDAVTLTCQEKGAHVIASVLDVTDRLKMEQWLLALDDEHPIDLVIANAGISAGTGGVLVGEDPAQVRHVFDVNLHGVLNTVEPVQGRMLVRGKGQIALMSSLAGYRGWPGAPAYCGSKAAVKVYGESLRGVLKKTGIRVNVVCPGFVKSRITACNEFPMPFLVDAERAAEIISKGLRKNQGRIVFPFIPGLMSWFCMVLPDFVAQYILSFSPDKSVENQ
ncbi:MAG: short-chain dehydrogenase [Alphaproteobacteria bacterium]|nr:MAG: short-chain dehydrogenase [Alphaproteobacteria bacterium]